MAFSRNEVVRLGFVLPLLACALNATPRLSLSQTAIGPLSIAAGANGPLQTVNATNLGDGSLNLSASSSVTWLNPTVSGTSVQIGLQTSGLAKGAYTGFVTVSAPNVIDAPQTISVTVNIGGQVPDQLTYYVPPGGTATTQFTTGSPVTSNISFAPWLSIAINGSGTFTFNVPYQVTVNAGTMAAGAYNGTLTLAGSNFASDNKAIPVTLNVTTQPIIQLNPASALFTIAAGAAKQTAFVSVANGGQGTLSISNVAATTSTGTWLSATAASANLISITADPTGLTPNTYQGTVTITSDAANAVTIPVQLTVVASGPPIAGAGGAVNNGTFAANEPLAAGDIVAVFGQQFTNGNPIAAQSVPLATTLATTQVLVNGQPAPLYFVSTGQINFQLPYETSFGAGTVQVVRDNQMGNSIYVNIAASVPRFIVINGYPIVATAQGALTAIPSSPVHRGDTVVVYALGMGQTVPPVTSGQAAPTSPLAVTSPTARICLGGQNGPFGAPAVCTTALFSGLTPGFVGLYQINVTIPATAPTGNSVPVYIQSGSVVSTISQIAIQ